MEYAKIQIIGNSIFFGGYEVAKIKKGIPLSLKGNFEQAIYELQNSMMNIVDTIKDLGYFEI